MIFCWLYCVSWSSCYVIFVPSSLRDTQIFVTSNRIVLTILAGIDACWVRTVTFIFASIYDFFAYTRMFQVFCISSESGPGCYIDQRVKCVFPAS